MELVNEKNTFLPDNIISVCSSSSTSAHVSFDEDRIASTTVRIPFLCGQRHRETDDKVSRQ